jgi:hypothetical protein
LHFIKIARLQELPYRENAVSVLKDSSFLIASKQFNKRHCSNAAPVLTEAALLFYSGYCSTK